jgi:hypothetical protein
MPLPAAQLGVATFPVGKSATGHIVPGISVYTQRQSPGRSAGTEKALAERLS